MQLFRQASDLPANLICYLFCLPLAFGIVGKSFTIADIAMIGLVLTRMIKFLFNPTLRISHFDAFFLAFVGVALTGHNVLSHSGAFTFELGSLILLYVGSVIIADLLSTAKEFKHFIELTGSMLAVLLAFSGIVIFLKMAGLTEETAIFFSKHNTYRAMFNFTNQLAIFLICLWPIAVLRFAESTWKRLLLYAAFFLTVSSIGSRSGFWLALVQTLLVEIFLPPPRRILNIVLSCLAVGCIIALVISLLATDLGLQRSLGNLEKASLGFDESRVVNYRQAINSSPTWIRGYGLGCFDQTHRHEVHNTPFSLLVETGVFGFSIVAFVFISLLWLFFQSVPPEEFAKVKVALYLAWGGIVAVGMFHYLLRNRAAWIVFALTMAFVKLSKREMSI